MKFLKDLGVRLKWKFDFLPPGKTVNPLPNTIFVDVGNQLTKGIIDTHQQTNYRSSAHALAENPDLLLNHLLNGLNETYAKGEHAKIDRLEEIEFTYITHTFPDWDSVATFYLCDLYLREGTAHSSKIKKLIEATNEIDQGTAVMEGKVERPFMVYYNINSSFEENIRKGKELIEEVCKLFEEKKIGQKGNPFLEHREDLESLLPTFGHHIQELREDSKKFEADLEKRTGEFDVELPLNNGGNDHYESVKALYFSEDPTCKLHKYWVRDKNIYKLLIIPYSINSEITKRWVISVDSNGPYNLRRLGYSLEKAEVKKRGKEHRRYGAPRWGDKEYSDNDNPWYDGRDHDHTIVDSPMGGTHLRDFNEIKSVICNRFHGIKIPEKNSNALTFFFYFELPEDKEANQFLNEQGFSKESKPFIKFDRAFKFIQNIDLHIKKESDFENSHDVFERELWAGASTLHGVMKLTVKDFNKTLVYHTSKSVNILEDMRSALDHIETSAQKLARDIFKKHNLVTDIWGLSSFRFMELSMPDLKFHDPNKVNEVFNGILRENISREKIDELMAGRGIEHIKSSHALCVLSEAEQCHGNLSSDRKQLLFYALFLKTGYRHFSERMSKVAEKLGKEQKQSQQDKEMSVLRKIQKDYSIFLGKYDFSEREVNTDNGLQSFFNDVLRTMGFHEQKSETRHEMETTYDLAAAENRDKLEQENRNLQAAVVGIGVLALGDFFYSWLSPEYPGWVVLVSLVALATTSAFLIRKKR